MTSSTSNHFRRHLVWGQLSLLAIQSQFQQVSSAAPCSILTEAMFNTLATSATAPYSYAGFCTAVTDYNTRYPSDQVFMGSTEMEQRHELAAFLGNTLHESDEFRAGREYLMCADNKQVGGVTYCKPCDSANFDWGTKTCSSSLVSSSTSINSYCDSSKTPATTPDGCTCSAQSEDASQPGYVQANKLFFGRGAIQLSWNYNYIDASTALTGSASTFCDAPDVVATNEAYAWGVGLYFWMQNTGSNGKTCHTSVLTDKDFGGTLSVINGGLECPAVSSHVESVYLRLNQYCRAATALSVDSLLGLTGCMDLETRLTECLAASKCLACSTWAITTTTTTVSLKFFRHIHWSFIFGELTF